MKGGETMQKKINGFLAIALFGAFSLFAGCAARDVDVSNRGGVRSDTSVESNSSSSSSQTQQNQKPRSSSSSGATGSGAYSGSTSSGTGSSSRSSSESGS
jgi:hypothetical protein